MPTFEFLVTRPTTESSHVSIEADSIEEAHNKAIAEAREGRVTEWLTDDYIGEPYIPDENDYEEVSDG